MVHPTQSTHGGLVGSTDLQHRVPALVLRHIVRWDEAVGAEAAHGLGVEALT
jgi:hypothetical protein